MLGEDVVVELSREMVYLIKRPFFAGFRVGTGFFERYSRPFRQLFQGLMKIHTLHFLNKSEHIPRLITPKTFKYLKFARDHKRRSLFGMKRTQAFIVTSGFCQRYIRANYVHYICFLFYFGDLIHWQMYIILRSCSQLRK